MGKQGKSFGNLPEDTHEGCAGLASQPGLCDPSAPPGLPWERREVCLAQKSGAGFPEGVTFDQVWEDTRLGYWGVAVTHTRQKPEGVTRSGHMLAAP